MNAHSPIVAAVPDRLDDISLLDVEDLVNTALNAILLAHDNVEDFCNSHVKRDAEAANTASYAIGHAREMVRDVHRIFHAYLVQEFAKRTVTA